TYDMGQTLSEPLTDKTTTEGNDKRVLYGASSMQGWRTNMEDAHTTISSYGESGASFFAVFDGHGGEAVAKYSGKKLYKKIMDTPAFERGRYRDAIRTGYYGIDEDLLKDPAFEEDHSGCTAVAALLTRNNVLYVSNAGDSRAVISTRDGRAIPLSQDHKPKLPKEELRIRTAGGHVENAEPDIIEHLLTDHDEFVVLACDGIWDCLSNQQVVDFIRYQLCQHKSMGPICEELMDYCLAEKANMAGIGCDNMTVVIIGFLRRRTPQEWYDWMASKPCPNLPTKKAILLAPIEKKQ
ncbi:hypothetical protein INT48_006758, partial [Thamnidium elegans]